ncbi:MAG: hypothetical protein K0Q49_1669 [Haloplasmataceae bacterium]|jgi:predicted transcriptional regulator|nr:hypothetical protein [Haloplasmataceae bacterium]
MDELKVKLYMTKPVLTLKPYDTIKDASVMMLEHNIGSIPVVDDENYPVGIITDRDIIIRGIAQNKDEHTKLDEIMTTTVLTVSEDDTLGTATHIMGNQQVRRLVVIDKNDKVTGFLAMADISTTPEGDAKAGIALSKISLKSTDINSNPHHGTDVHDFPL